MILAKAGLERLGLYAPETVVQGRKLYMRPLSVEAFIPAVGQGIVGMECRASDRRTKELLAGINDAETCACGVAERTFLVRLGASGSTPRGRGTPAWKGMNWFCARHITCREGKNPSPSLSAGTGTLRKPWEFWPLKNWA